MYLIAGLGNPTKEYQHTRHNMGWDCVDILAGRLGCTLKRSRFGALVGKTQIAGEPVLLVKPLTYMNLSGNAIAPLAKYYNVDTRKNLIVIYDDTDLETGMIRLRKKGSSGGHNGMKSIISSLGHEEFFRIRIGIGKREKDSDMIDFVLGKFGKEDRKLIDDALKRAADSVEDSIENGQGHAMNKYNQNKSEC